MRKMTDLKPIEQSKNEFILVDCIPKEPKPEENHECQKDEFTCYTNSNGNLALFFDACDEFYNGEVEILVCPFCGEKN